MFMCIAIYLVRLCRLHGIYIFFCIFFTVMFTVLTFNHQSKRIVLVHIQVYIQSADFMEG